jgi:hypothetical protein
MRVPFLLLTIQAVIIFCDWLTTRLRGEIPHRQ